MTTGSATEEVEMEYESPALVDYGTIEEWTLGLTGSIINISLIL